MKKMQKSSKKYRKTLESVRKCEITLNLQNNAEKFKFESRVMHELVTKDIELIDYKSRVKLEYE